MLGGGNLLPSDKTFLPSKSGSRREGLTVVFLTQTDISILYVAFRGFFSLPQPRGQTPCSFFYL